MMREVKSLIIDMLKYNNKTKQESRKMICAGLCCPVMFVGSVSECSKCVVVRVV